MILIVRVMSGLSGIMDFKGADSIIDLKKALFNQLPFFVCTSMFTDNAITTSKDTCLSEIC
jgi:hypothetical protein